MKKGFYAIIIAVIFCSACSDGKDDVIESPHLITVKASEVKDLYDDVYEVRVVLPDGGKVLKTIKWDNGFQYELPELVSPSYLSSFINDNLAGQLTVSGDIKAAWLEFHLYSYEGDFLGELFHGVISSVGDTVYVGYLYSDGKFSAKGTISHDNGYREIFDVAITKGWNRMATKSIFKNVIETDVEYTTKIPDNMGWICYMWPEGSSR